jgi:hypothetical protein
MKNLFLLLLLIWGSNLSAQNKIKWDTLPVKGNNNPIDRILYQTKQGYILAYLSFGNKMVISKNKAKSWQDITVPKSIENQLITDFISDKKGEIYCFKDESIYMLDRKENKFELYLKDTFPIYDAVFNEDYLYTITYSNFKIYEKNNSNPIVTHNVHTDDGAKVVFTKNKNYIFTGYSFPDTYTFDGNGSNLDTITIDKDFQVSDVFKSGKMLAGLSTKSGTYISDDAVSWSLWMDNKAYKEKRVLCINDKNEIFMALNRQLYKSSDEAKTWTKINTPLPSNAIFDLYNNKNNELVLYSNYPKNQLYISSNNGKKWKKRNCYIDAPSFQPLIVANYGIISSNGNFRGLYSYLEKGKNTWRQISVSDSTIIGDMFELSSGKWFAKDITYKENKYYVSENKGKSWKEFDNLPKDISDKRFYHLYKIGKDSILILENEKYHLSDNGGNSWTSVTITGFKSENYFANKQVVFKNNNIISINYNKFSRYKINEKNYSERYLEKKRIDGNQIFKADHLSCTKNEKIYFIAKYEDSYNADSYLFSSNDLGKTFEQIKLPDYYNSLSDFAIDTNDNLIFLDRFGSTIHISFDSGKTWVILVKETEVNGGFTSMCVDNNNLYVGHKRGYLLRCKIPSPDGK